MMSCGSRQAPARIEFWLGVGLAVVLIVAPFALGATFGIWERFAVVSAVDAATRHAGSGVPEGDVVRVLGEPESVFYQPVHFEHPVRGRLLRYRFGLAAYLYVYVDSDGSVECALVDAD